VFAKIVISADPFLVLKKPDRFPDQLYYILLSVFVLSVLFTIGSSYSLFLQRHRPSSRATCCSRQCGMLPAATFELRKCIVTFHREVLKTSFELLRNKNHVSTSILLAASQHKRMIHTSFCMYRKVPPDDEQ
jgi:hypothetical protein